MNARVKKRKLQAKTAIMIMAPKKAKALLWVVATKPLPVRLRSSVGVRRDGRASRIVICGDALWLVAWMVLSATTLAAASALVMLWRRRRARSKQRQPSATQNKQSAPKDLSPHGYEAAKGCPRAAKSSQGRPGAARSGPRPSGAPKCSKS